MKNGRPTPKRLPHEVNATYVLDWVGNQSPETDWGSLFRTAPRTLGAAGPVEWSFPSQTDLDANTGPKGDESAASAICGAILKFGEFETHDLSRDDLHFQLIDYGDTIRLNLALRRELGSSGETERNRCTLIHVSEAMVWLNQRQSKTGSISQSGFKELASELRQGELIAAKTITEHISTAETAVEKELVSLRHDVLSPGRDVDFRTVGLLVLPGLENPPG